MPLSVVVVLWQAETRGRTAKKIFVDRNDCDKTKGRPSSKFASQHSTVTSTCPTVPTEGGQQPQLPKQLSLVEVLR